jgi:hypothetical protein
MRAGNSSPRLPSDPWRHRKRKHYQRKKVLQIKHLRFAKRVTKGGKRLQKLVFTRIIGDSA